MDYSTFAKELGRRGGESTVKKYGAELEVIRKHSFLPDGVLVAPDPAHAAKTKEFYMQKKKEAKERRTSHSRR